MGVVEKAGGSLHDAVPARRASNAPANYFDLENNRLKTAGLYNLESSSTQLALELRAIKRRLLRRIGFLRSTGERRGFRKPGRQKNLILVTSTRSGEGKTYNSANLALSFSIEDRIETLAMDCDFIRPQLGKYLGAPGGPGLSECILDPTVAVEAVQWRANQAPLTVISAGARVQKTTEIFSSESAQNLWTELSRAAPDRLVIIDAPPVLASTDAVILAKYVDEVVFVIEANSTPEPAVAAAIDEILDINPNVSMILNKCLIGSGGSHYGSYEYYSTDGRETGKRGDAGDGQ